jgi:hypothetical protein
VASLYLFAADVAGIDPIYLRIGITVIACLVLVGRWFFPQIKVDAVTFGLLVVALLPWLAPIIQSVEVAGVGKIELRDLQEQVQDNALTANAALQKAQAATGLARSNQSITQPPAEVNRRIDDLARQYSEVRRSRATGFARTSATTEIVSQMIALAPHAGPIDIGRALRSQDPGNRLKALCYLYARPDPAYLDELIDVTSKETQPFLQHWGIQAIEAITATGVPISETTRSALNNLAKAVTDPQDPSRTAEVRRILDRAARE